MAGKLCVKEVTVGMLGTCCYIVWREGADACVVIDPGAEPERILRAAEGKRIDAILLTHGHFDHIGAVEELRRDGAQVVIHRLDAPMLTDNELNASWMVGAPLNVSEADVTVREGDVITFADIAFTVMHTPGHTPGSACYQAEDQLFTGDTLFHMGWGRTDLPGGSDAEMHRSLERLYPLARKYPIHPGHGG
ncbi:MAG: MBL fold metallo-hydrolase [Clostridia bacterium]|nr:MBL fold metallo-hydrolase [Clostridia bacterium]